MGAGNVASKGGRSANKSMRLPLILALVTAGVAQAQVIITSEDMFNQVGQYYRTHAFKGEVSFFGQETTSVAGRLGRAGGPQLWDFRVGPTDETHRFDVVAASDDGHNTEFPKATFAERKTEESTGIRSWSYFDQVKGVGRVNYGFYGGEELSFLLTLTSPAVAFASPIVDFPETIRFGDAWSSTANFKLEATFDTGVDPEDPEGGGALTIPVTVKRVSSAKVDAFGVVRLPGGASADALRVNELVTSEIVFDLGEGVPFPPQTSYLRNYYWLVEDRGVAVQITSAATNPSTGLPPEDFAEAIEFLRLFETNHAAGQSPVEQVGGLEIDLRRDSAGRITRAELSWIPVSTMKQYRVEYTDDLTAGRWTELRTTDLNLVIDTSISGTATRFYRLIGLKN